MYIGGTLELRKLDFRSFEGQFAVKNANFRELTAKIPQWMIFIDKARQILLLRYIRGILELKKLDFRGLKGRFDVK